MDTMKLATRLAAFAAATIVIGCSRGTDPAAEARIIGDWEKLERSMPPVNLLVIRDGDVLRGRLRLSGVELNGTVTIDGSRVVLHLPDDATISGELISDRELQLDMDFPVRTTLRKRVR